MKTILKHSRHLTLETLIYFVLLPEGGLCFILENWVSGLGFSMIVEGSINLLALMRKRCYLADCCFVWRHVHTGCFDSNFRTFHTIFIIVFQTLKPRPNRLENCSDLSSHAQSMQVVMQSWM